MNGFKHMLVVGAAVAALGGSYAAAAVVAPFTYSYEGDALPASSSPAWERYFTGDDSVAGGALTVTTPGVNHVGSPTDDNNLEYRQTGGAGNPWNGSSSGNTVEIKINSISNAASYSWAGGLLIGTTVHSYGILVGEHYVTVRDVGDFGITLNDAPHILRFTTDDTGAGQLNMYVDGNTSPAKTWTGNEHTVSTTNRFAFGDLGNSSSGTVVWDYVRWTNDGAFAPVAVPEPSVLSAAVLGGLALMGRRRK